MRLPPPPIKAPIYVQAGVMSPVWRQWWQMLYDNLGGTDGILTVERGGTGIDTGTSGGILGFVATDQMASSGLLATNRLVLGGGAGATPSTPVALGTSSQVLHGNATGQPSWGAVALAAEVSGILPVANGGTGISSGTSGGVLGYTAAGTIASSAALAANALVLGGGVGQTPTTPVGIGTTTTVLHGNALGAPTWGSVSLTADVSGVLPETKGGTNQSTYTLGDTLYASAANTLSKLAGNTTGTRKFLRQTGTGAASAAPAWDTILAADVPGAALTKVDDTNVTLTLGGSPTTALLNAASVTVGWSGQLGLTRGGTNASLVASNGGIFYSTATAAAILAGTATAGQVLRSGASTTPSWSTATYPSAAGSAGNVLRSDGTNLLSAQLAAADLSNGTTGSGSVVLSASPTLTGTLTASAGSFSSTVGVTGLLTATGGLKTNKAPSSEWGIDQTGANQLITIADTATYDLAVGSGLVIIHNDSTGRAGVFLMEAGVSTLISDPAAAYGTAVGTAGRTNLYYNGATAYRIQNLTGGSKNYYVTTIKTRANT